MGAYLFLINDIPLPVTPEKMDQHYRSSTKTITTIENGEIVLLDRKGMLEFNFTFLLPQFDFSNVYDLRTYLRSITGVEDAYWKYFESVGYSARWYLDMLIDYKNEAKVFTFTVLQTPTQGKLLYDVCKPCVIDTLRIQYGEHSNNMLSIEVTFLEYRDTTIEQYQIQDKSMKMIQNYRRLPTTFYDPSNIMEYLDCGVHFLEDQLKQRTSQTIQNLGSSAISTIQTAYDKVNQYMPPILMHSFKIVAWMGVKAALVNMGLGLVAALL